MSTKESALNQVHEMSGSRRLASMMTLMAWVVLGVGALLCLFNVSEFKDTNMGLMVGLGCLISSVVIYTIGTSMNLIDRKW